MNIIWADFEIKVSKWMPKSMKDDIENSTLFQSIFLGNATLTYSHLLEMRADMEKRNIHVSGLN